MILPPFSVIATWKPNYDDPPTWGPIVFIINSIFLFFATIAVGIRLYTRIAIRRWLGVDDAFIVFAFVWHSATWTGGLDTYFNKVLNVGLISIVFNAILSYGWNRHIYDIPFDRLECMSSIDLRADQPFCAPEAS